MSVNGEIHNAYNVYIIKKTDTTVTKGSFTKETNNFWSTEQRNNSSAEETLKTAYWKSKESCKNLKTDWLKLYRMEMCT